MPKICGLAEASKGGLLRREIRCSTCSVLLRGKQGKQESELSLHYGVRSSLTDIMIVEKQNVCEEDFLCLLVYSVGHL